MNTGVQWMRNITLCAVLMAISAIFLLGLVHAADIQGATTTIISSSNGTAASAGTVSAAGGNVTAVNISSNAITNRWAGFYGNISGTVHLADASGNLFYKWTVSSVTNSVVYATNGTVSNWSSLAAAAFTNEPTYLQQSGSDNYSNTFTANEQFVSPLHTVNSVDYTYTLNSSAQQSVFKTYALVASATPSNDKSIIVYAGKAVQQSNAFNNGAVDFQILAPATSPTTYYFYLELP